MNANERLAHAAEYLRLAQSCRDPDNRLRLLRLALMWRHQAQSRLEGLGASAARAGRARAHGVARRGKLSAG
jgi:hypothetical protein